MEHTLIVALLYQIPEGILISMAGLGLLGVKSPVWRIILVGVLYGVLVPAVRGLGMPFGVHTWVLFVLFVFLATRLVRVKVLTAITAWMLALFLIFLGQDVILFPVARSMGISLESTLATPLSHVLWGWVSAGLLLAVALATHLTRLVLIPAPEAERVNVHRG